MNPIQEMISMIVDGIAEEIHKAEKPSNGKIGLGEIIIGDRNYQIQMMVISEDDKGQWINPDEIIVTEVKK